MPVDVEKGMFTFLMNHAHFNRIKERLREDQCEISYNICFSHWSENEYGTDELNNWFNDLEQSIRKLDILYDFWRSDNQESIDQFMELFISGYNEIAQKEGLDYLILSN